MILLNFSSLFFCILCGVLAKYSKGSNHVVKRIGHDSSTSLDYSECVGTDDDVYIHYDVDLYQYETLDILCPKLTDDVSTVFEPKELDGYYSSGRYDVLMSDRYVDEVVGRSIIRLKDELSFIKITKQEDVYNIAYGDGDVPKNVIKMYFDCHSKSSTGKLTHLSTIQVNIMPDIKGIIGTSTTINFDHFRLMPKGNKLIYIKSIRLGTKLISNCSKKLDIKSKSDNIDKKDKFGTLLSYNDISSTYTTRNYGMNSFILDLIDDDKVIWRDNKCIIEITCNDDNDRKLIYVYPNYNRYNGFNINTELKDTKDGLYRLPTVIDTSKSNVISVDIPKGSNTKPKDYFESFYIDNYKLMRLNNIVDDVRLIKITNTIKILDFNNMRNYTYMTLGFRTNNKDDDIHSMLIQLAPKCYFNDNKIFNSKYNECTIFFSIKDKFQIIHDRDDDMDGFNAVPYMRIDDPNGTCKDCYYKKLIRDKPNKILHASSSFSNNLYFNLFPGRIEANPMYFIRKSKVGDEINGILNPIGMIKVYLSNSSLYADDNGIVKRSSDGVDDYTLYYSLTMNNSNIAKLRCRTLFREYNENTFIQPHGNNVYFNNVPYGDVNLDTLEINDLDSYAYRGIEINTYDRSARGEGSEEGSDGSSIMGMMDDGATGVLDVTSSGSGIPESDLRELEGEINRRADGRNVTSGGEADGRTTSSVGSIVDSDYDLVIKLDTNKFITGLELKPLFFVCHMNRKNKPYAIISFDPGYYNKRLYGCGIEPSMFLNDDNKFSNDKNCIFNFDINKKYAFHCPVHYDNDIKKNKKNHIILDSNNHKEYKPNNTVYCFENLKNKVKQNTNVLDEEIKINDNKSIWIFDNAKILNKKNVNNFECICISEIGHIQSSMTIIVNSTSGFILYSTLITLAIFTIVF